MSNFGEFGRRRYYVILRIGKTEENKVNPKSPKLHMIQNLVVFELSIS